MKITKTENKHNQFRYSESFFKMVIESLEDYAIFTTDPKGVVSSWNKGAQKIFKFKEEEIIGKDSAILFTKEDLKNHIDQKELLIALADGKALDERWHVRKDRTKFWASGLVFPLKDKNDQIRGYTKIARDLTQRQKLLQKNKLIQEETNRQLRIYDIALSNTLDYNYIFDTNGRFIYVNKPLLKLWGMNQKQALGKNFEELGYPKELVKLHQSQITKVIKTKKPVKGENLYTNKNGEVGYYDYTFVPAINELGQVEAIVGTTHDVTKRKKVDKQKDSFLGIVSHELKTPVTSLKAFAQVLQNRFKKEGNQNAADLLGKMDSQIDKLNILIEDLLAATKITGGKLNFNYQLFDLDKLINEVVEEVQRTTKTHKIVSNPKPSVKLYGDQERIGQVITNLLTNAIKYSPEANQVILSTVLEEKWITLCVQDFGIGIPKNKQEKVFDQFFRVNRSPSVKISGVGLGLFIAAEIIKRHKGKIWLESQVGKGSKFCFKLPLPKPQKKKLLNGLK